MPVDLEAVVEQAVQVLDDLPEPQRTPAAEAAARAVVGPLTAQLCDVLAEAVAALPVGSLDGQSDEALRYARAEIARQIRSGVLLRLTLV